MSVIVTCYTGNKSPSILAFSILRTNNESEWWMFYEHFWQCMFIFLHIPLRLTHKCKKKCLQKNGSCFMSLALVLYCSVTQIDVLCYIRNKIGWVFCIFIYFKKVLNLYWFFVLPKIYLIVDELFINILHFQNSLVKPAMVLLLPSISLLVETDCPCVQSNPVTFWLFSHSCIP